MHPRTPGRPAGRGGGKLTLKYVHLLGEREGRLSGDGGVGGLQLQRPSLKDLLAPNGEKKKKQQVAACVGV